MYGLFSWDIYLYCSCVWDSKTDILSLDYRKQVCFYLFLMETLILLGQENFNTKTEIIFLCFYVLNFGMMWKLTWISLFSLVKKHWTKAGTVLQDSCTVFCPVPRWESTDHFLLPLQMSAHHLSHAFCPSPRHEFQYLLPIFKKNLGWTYLQLPWWCFSCLEAELFHARHCHVCRFPSDVCSSFWLETF